MDYKFNISFTFILTVKLIIYIFFFFKYTFFRFVKRNLNDVLNFDKNNRMTNNSDILKLII